MEAREIRPTDLIPVNYWDYIQVDLLLNLQKPRTHFPDEKIFIGYHQVTELLLMLATHELEQLTNSDLDAGTFLDKLGRIHRYLGMCAQSFEVMRMGMDWGQYNTFRHALAPASGFQSFSFRKFELMSTDLIHLVRHDKRPAMAADAEVEDLLKEIYWRRAGLDLSSGQRTPTMQQFEDRYWSELLALGEGYRERNLWRRYNAMVPDVEAGYAQSIREAMRKLDLLFNQEWPLVHYRAACRYLDGGEQAGTGGSDWKAYLHPRSQRRIFFPSLWTDAELAAWGDLNLE